jgi:Glycosyl-hydrolase family 116, catalytic region
MQKSLAYLQGLIPPESSLPESAPLFANTYDIIPVNGYDIYDCQLYLLSLEIVIDASQRLGQPPAGLAPLQADLAQAKSHFEQLFWDPAYQFYRYTPGPATPQPTPTDEVMLDSFFAPHRVRLHRHFRDGSAAPPGRAIGHRGRHGPGSPRISPISGRVLICVQRSRSRCGRCLTSIRRSGAAVASPVAMFCPLPLPGCLVA